ncbi:MAG: response regulator [Desulfobulbus sp.]|nr:response regulator [Desulfobulbus sp.]
MDWLDRLEKGDFCGPLIFSYDDPVRIGTQQITLNLVPVAEGETFFVIGILQNVTRRKILEQRQRRLENELQRIRKLEAMSLMAGGISHDFNNLLTVIRGNVEMANYVCQQEDIRQMLDEANKAISLTTQLIHRFTTFSNNYIPQKSQVYLLALIAEVLDQELAHTDICFEIHCKEDDFVVSVDPHLMQQVFVNLANNAVDAMAETGRIDVYVDRVNGNEESVRIGQLVPKGELIRLVFADSGPGIPLASLDQVFDPYFSTKQKGIQKGMGLGLTIVHAITKKHGGSVHIQTPREEGCRVVLYFPAHGIAGAEHRSAHGRTQRRRVLIVDDEEMVRIPTRKMFEHFGCMVAEASSVEKAITLYRQELESGRAFDLVLVDLHMTQAAGKADAAHEILALDSEAAVIAVSGDRDNKMMHQYSDHGFVFAMEKPFSIETVEEVVNRFL